MIIRGLLINLPTQRLSFQIHSSFSQKISPHYSLQNPLLWRVRWYEIIILINTSMSYVERIIIGAVLILSAYSLYTGAEQRHQFHLAISQLSALLGRCLGCFNCIQDYRSALVVLVFSAGAALVMDAGVTIAIIAQTLLTAIDLTHFKDGWEVDELQSILINVAILVFLFRNIADFRQREIVPVETVHSKEGVKNASTEKTEEKEKEEVKEVTREEVSRAAAKPRRHK